MEFDIDREVDIHREVVGRAVVASRRYPSAIDAGGEITACEPPRHLALTWEFGGDVSWVDRTAPVYTGQG